MGGHHFRDQTTTVDPKTGEMVYFGRVPDLRYHDSYINPWKVENQALQTIEMAKIHELTAELLI